MKKRTLDHVIRKALDRELTKMQDNEIYGDKNTRSINRWSGVALASWVAPGVIKSVERHLQSLSHDEKTDKEKGDE